MIVAPQFFVSRWRWRFGAQANLLCLTCAYISSPSSKRIALSSSARHSHYPSRPHCPIHRHRFPQSTMVLLVTSDNEQFVVDKEVAERSVLIKNMLEDVGESDQPIPLPNVSSSVLKKVLEYCEHHRGEPLPTAESEQSQDETRKRTTDISEWDQKFITVDQEMLFEIILAANYLDIKPLLDVGCKTVANMIKGKTPEEIRKLFNIVNDFTPEEEAQIKKENEWAEDR